MFYKKRIIFGVTFLILFFTMMAYGMSRHSNHSHYDSPHYKEMLRDEINFLNQELERDEIEQEYKEHLKERIEDIKLELEVGYEKAREMFLKREKNYLEESLANNNMDERTRKQIMAQLAIVDAKLEHGEGSPEVRKLELEGGLLSLRASLEDTRNPQDKMRLEMAIREIELNLEKTQFENNENAFSLLIMFFINASTFLLPLIVILVASEAISGEYSLGTIKLLLIKPFTRTKLYISKFIALILYGISLFIFMGIVGYIIGGFFVGFGGASLTRIVGQVRLGREFGYIADYSSAYLVTNFQYLLMVMGLFMVMLSVIVAFSMFISVFTKSATISIVSTMGLITFGSIVSGIFNRQYFVRLLPMPHFELIRHLDGNFWVQGVSLNFSIVILTLYCLLFLALGVYSFDKKDIV